MLKTNFLNQTFKNPLVTASGILWVTADCMIDVIKRWAGWVTTKSININSRKGHPNPTVLWLWKEIGIINAVGLSGEGIINANEEYIRFKEKCDAPLIISIFWGTLNEIAEVAKIANTTPADIIEVNISCPNVEDEHGRPFACDLVSAQQATETVKKHCPSKPVVMKLSPNVPNIAMIAKGCEEAGADWICAINTAWPGLVIDPFLRAPILANKVGGLSGKAIKPIAMKAVWDIAKEINIPIIGTGGIETWQDAIEMIMVGATLIWVWTAVYTRDEYWAGVYGQIAKEMEEFMKAEKISSLEEIRWIIK